MRKRIVFATGNEGKMDEVRAIMKGSGYEVLSKKDVGVEEEVEEDGDTFEANAILKAKAMMEKTKEIVMADDSGLEVDYLDKAPGVYSARYLGEGTPYHVKNNHIVELLKEAKGDERSARFVCAIACAFPDGRIVTTRGVLEGRIGYGEKGENGFGYDPIFYLPEYGCTSAELASEEKNEISHRGRALQAMKELLQRESIDNE